MSVLVLVNGSDSFTPKSDNCSRIFPKMLSAMLLNITYTKVSPYTSKHLLRRYLDPKTYLKHRTSAGIWMSRVGMVTNQTLIPPFLNACWSNISTSATAPVLGLLATASLRELVRCWDRKVSEVVMKIGGDLVVVCGEGNQPAERLKIT